jgi:hypothetical protein
MLQKLMSHIVQFVVINITYHCANCVVEQWVVCILKEKGLELNNTKSYSGPKFESPLHTAGKALARAMAPHVSTVQYSSN